MFRFVSWVKVMARKTSYLVANPKALWKERCEEARARVWAREMASKTE